VKFYRNILKNERNLIYNGFTVDSSPKVVGRQDFFLLLSPILPALYLR
jgi:hypothetical protein